MRWLAGLILLASPATAVTCEDIEHRGASYTICEVKLDDDLQLFLRDSDGNILGGFDRVETHTGRPLAFAMNAGMYHEDRDPVGHYIEDGTEEMRVISSAGPGNFGLLPNGIFCISDTYRVLETLAYLDERPNCTHATGTASAPTLTVQSPFSQFPTKP